MLTKAACVITRDRAESLSRCLDCLIAQSPKFDEMIVVDNSVSDATKDMIAERYPLVRYIRCFYGLGALPIQRNLGIKACCCDLICFVDDDGYAEPGWLGEIAKVYHAYTDAGAVGGRIIQGETTRAVPGRPPPIGRFGILKWSWGTFNADVDDIVRVDILQGTNMTFKVKALKACRGFDEILAHGYASFEDTDACLGVRAAGFSVYFNPKAVVVHGLEPREKNLSRDIGAAPSLARSFARNGTYLQLKYYARQPRAVIALFTVIPAINIIRCVLPKVKGRRRFRLFAVIRVRSAFAFVVGVGDGICCWLRSRKTATDYLTESP